MKTHSVPNVSKKLKAIAVFIFTLISSSLLAQSAQTEVEIIQEALGLEKKAAIANFMELGNDAESFWKIYNEYEAERKELGMNRIKIIADYARSYPTISDEKILELFKKTSAVKKEFANLQKKYFKKMKKEIGVSKAAQFWQLEGYFNAIIQANIYSQIPFIGENLSGE